MVNTTVNGKVEAALKRLRHFHAKGAASLAECPGRPKYGSMRDIDNKGESSELLRKARNFADLFNEAELDELCELCKRHDFPLGIGHILRLLRVQKNQQAFCRRAIKNGWSAKQLDVEILRRNKTHHQAGRRRHVPKDAFEAYFQINRFCDQWQRLRQSLQSPASRGVKRRLQYRSDLDQAVCGNLRKADNVLMNLRLTSAVVLGSSVY